MKKVFLLLCLLATTTIATATDLWEGTHAVDWSNTLTTKLSASTQRLTARIMSSMCSPDGMKAVSWATRPR